LFFLLAEFFKLSTEVLLTKTTPTAWANTEIWQKMTPKAQKDAQLMQKFAVKTAQKRRPNGSKLSYSQMVPI
jgi:hypothetical protein